MRRALRWLVIGGAWTVPGLLNAAQYYMAPGGGDWANALARGLPRYYLWALLTPAVLWLARRSRPDREHVLAPLALHAAAAAALSSLHLLLAAAYYWTMFYAAAGRGFASVVANYFSTAFAVDYLVYWTVLGAFYAFDYFRVAQERELRATRLEARLAEARLRVLETQLNPHFLFNALHTISALALQDDRERTVRMLTRLSDLLRLSLRHRGSTVPLRRELELVGRYLEIERARFADRLSVEYRIAPEAWDAAVPSFLIQPLVENAIRHGIAASPGHGRVAISASAADGTLEVAVQDTGPGPTADAPGGAGIGLENTRARLRELYGDAAALELVRDPGGGAIARVRLPLSRSDEPDLDADARYDAVAVSHPSADHRGGDPGRAAEESAHARPDE